MISRCIKFAFIFLLFIVGCKRKKRNEFTLHPQGYFWKLISFSTDSNEYKTNNIAWVNASFSTQNDSLFYDSKHDLRDRFFVAIDSNQSNSLRSLISRFSEGDSVNALMKPQVFFQQQFNGKVPFFSRKDSIVRVKFKIKRTFDSKQYEQMIQKIAGNEMKEIEAFFGSEEKFKNAKDSAGFYWVIKPSNINGETIRLGDVVTINYEGAFLDGRTVDISPKEFNLTLGTPDQVLKGLNYVIARLKTGDDSKIILPSQLAFGESGSSNGSIPPFTPMLYKIRIISKK